MNICRLLFMSSCGLVLSDFRENARRDFSGPCFRSIETESVCCDCRDVPDLCTGYRAASCDGLAVDSEEDDTLLRSISAMAAIRSAAMIGSDYEKSVVKYALALVGIVDLPYHAVDCRDRGEMVGRAVAVGMAGSIYGIKLYEEKGRGVAFEVRKYLVCYFWIAACTFDNAEVILDNAEIDWIPMGERCKRCIRTGLSDDPED